MLEEAENFVLLCFYSGNVDPGSRIPDPRSGIPSIVTSASKPENFFIVKVINIISLLIIMHRLFGTSKPAAPPPSLNDASGSINTRVEGLDQKIKALDIELW